MLRGGQTAGVFVGTANSDPARLGAQVISGIGFLGAGTIMNGGRSVRGLITAAILWVVACLGLAMGAGQYAIAIGGFLVSMIWLRMFKMPRYEISLLCSEQACSLEKICNMLELEEANISNFSCRSYDAQRMKVRFELYLGWKQRDVSTSELMRQISSIESVSQIEIDAI